MAQSASDEEDPEESEKKAAKLEEFVQQNVEQFKFVFGLHPPEHPLHFPADDAAPNTSAPAAVNEKKKRHPKET